MGAWIRHGAFSFWGMDLFCPKGPHKGRLDGAYVLP